MGKKLSSNEIKDSINAIQQFVFFCYKSKDVPCFHRICKVEASYQERSLFCAKVRVIIYGPFSNEGPLERINIFWEDAVGDSYRGQGLYGYYACSFVRMKFNPEQKALFLDDDGVTIKIYAEAE